MAIPRQSRLDPGQEWRLIERDLRQKQNVRGAAVLFSRKGASGGRPTRARPITSRANTFVDVRLIDATSNAASRIEVATYFAAEPNPGEQSVIGRSLSAVLGMPTQTIG